MFIVAVVIAFLLGHSHHTTVATGRRAEHLIAAGASVAAADHLAQVAGDLEDRFGPGTADDAVDAMIVMCGHQVAGDEDVDLLRHLGLNAAERAEVVAAVGGEGLIREGGVSGAQVAVAGAEVAERRSAAFAAAVARLP